MLIAWIRQKASYVFPIIGGHNATHLKENIDALKITLSNAQMAALDQSAAFDPGFPFNLFGTDPHANPGGMPNSPFTGTVSVMYTYRADVCRLARSGLFLALDEGTDFAGHRYTGDGWGKWGKWAEITFVCGRS